MKRLNISLFLGLVVLCSCHQQDQTSYVTTINKQIWNHTDQYKLPINISTSGDYDIYTLFRHNLKYAYTRFEGRVILIDEEKKDTINLKINLNLVDSAGKWVGSNLDDLMTYELPLKMNQHLEKGKYLAIFTSNMMDENLKSVLNIGLKIEPKN